MSDSEKQGYTTLRQIRRQRIVHANELAQKPSYHLSRTMHCIWLYMISKIKPTDSPDTEYAFSMDEFMPLMRFATDSITDIKIMVQQMADYSFWCDAEDPNERDHLLRFFKNVSCERAKRTIYLQFADEVQPYLFQIWEKHILYTGYSLQYMLILEKYYSQRLYSLLMSVANNKAFYFDINSGTPTDIFRILCTDVTHKKVVPDSWKNNFGYFKSRVLDPAIEDINKHTDLMVEYDLKRVDRYGNTSKKYSTIVFYIRKKIGKELDSVDKYIDEVYDKYDKKFERSVKRQNRQLSFDDLIDPKKLAQVCAIPEPEVVEEEVVDTVEEFSDEVPSYIRIKIEDYINVYNDIRLKIPEATVYEIFDILEEAERHIGKEISRDYYAEWVSDYVGFYTNMVSNPSVKAKAKTSIPNMLNVWCTKDYKGRAADVDTICLNRHGLKSKNSSTGKEKYSTYNNIMEHDYDFEELERLLVDNNN